MHKESERNFQTWEFPSGFFFCLKILQEYYRIVAITWSMAALSPKE